MASFKVLDIGDSDVWEKYIINLPLNQQDVYYTPEYYKLYENYGDGKAQCFVFEKEKDFALYPFLKNSVNSLGYILKKQYFDIQGVYGYNGVISTTNSLDFRISFYNAFHEFIKNENIIAEFTRFHPLINNVAFSEDFLDIYFDRKTVYVNLSKSIESIESSFSSSTNRAIRKAQKSELSLRVFQNTQFMEEEFIEMYIETMQRVNSNAYLYFNKEYFDRLFKLKNIIQFMVEYNKKPIASSICFYSKEYFHYHLGASKKDYLNHRPNDFLFKRMISFSKLKNCKYIHFGGGSTSFDNDGLYRFKKGFSNDSSNFCIGKKIHNHDVYDEVIRQWESKNPNKIEINKNLILKYRF